MKSIAGRKVTICIILTIILLLAGLSYALSYLITSLGAVIFLFTLIWVLVALVIDLLVFPGSYKCWLRMIEHSFSTELSSQTASKISNLSTFLLSLSDPSSGSTFPSSSLRYLQKLISSLLANFAKMDQEAGLSPVQQDFLVLLEDLKQKLCGTRVEIFSTPISLWEILEEPELCTASVEAHVLVESIDACTAVWKRLQEAAQRSLLRGGYILGDLQYMRADLLRRFHCEQFWVHAEDGVSVDCVWISGIAADEHSPVMIFCGPNATYYEYQYFQTDWIEMYVGAGVNLVMWNYRGYGRSGGSPNLGRVKKDGEALVRHLRGGRAARCRVLGVHGESLGGSIACHLARHAEVDFLFADRTFTSLGNVARYNFGKIAQLAFKVAGSKDCNAAEDFIETRCTKIMSCDCNDLMISGLGSLKSGVAVKYFEELGEGCLPFTGAEIREVYKALGTMQDSAKFCKELHIEKKKKKKGYLENSSLIASLYSNLKDIIENIDAGGESFFDLFVDCSEERIKTWVCVLGLWGSNPYVYDNDYFNKQQCTYEKLTAGAQELIILITEFSLSFQPEVKKALKLLETILNFLTKSKEWILTMQSEAEVVGKLLPLTCGHNGTMNSLERYLYEQHLKSAGIF